MSPNDLGISEVPSEARNLDRALAKSDTHLLSECDSTEPTKLARVVVGGFSYICDKC